MRWKPGSGFLKAMSNHLKSLYNCPIHKFLYSSSTKGFLDKCTLFGTSHNTSPAEKDRPGGLEEANPPHHHQEKDVVDNMEITAEEDLLLVEDERTETNKALLEVRKRYKKTQSQLSRVSSHEEFIRECQAKNITPRVLRVRVKCNALLPAYSNVRERFRQTQISTSCEY